MKMKLFVLLIIFSVLLSKVYNNLSFMKKNSFFKIDDDAGKPIESIISQNGYFYFN